MTHQTGSVRAAPGLQPTVIAAQDAQLLLTENIQIKHQQGSEAAGDSRRVNYSCAGWVEGVKASVFPLILAKAFGNSTALKS